MWWVLPNKDGKGVKSVEKKDAVSKKKRKEKIAKLSRKRNRRSH